jgi:hypothetical protein
MNGGDDATDDERVVQEVLTESLARDVHEVNDVASQTATAPVQWRP